MRLLTPGLLWFSAIGCGVLAGVYFAFSTFVMTALGRTGHAEGIGAMNAINVEIVKIDVYATVPRDAALADAFVDRRLRVLRRRHRSQIKTMREVPAVDQC